MDNKEIIKGKSCNCGCGGCAKAPILNEQLVARTGLSEGLLYHIDNKKPLTEHLFRAGSQKYFDLWKEARTLYSRDLLEVKGDDLDVLMETDLGHFELFNDVQVPLDFIFEEEVEDVPQYLYHATYKPLLKKIKERGLDTNDSKKAWDDSIPGYVYLALDPYVAESYAEESEMVPESWLDNIIILKIDTSKLDKSKLFTDQNVQDNEGDTLEYRGVIPWEALSLQTLQEIDEAEKKKKNPPIGKPKRGGSKKFYVYVRNPKTKKIKKVSFGDTTGLSAKINNPEARRAFAARHDCKNKKDRTKASFWSCRLPRYAKLLGLKSNFSGFW